jgi:hypothetical protein
MLISRAIRCFISGSWICKKWASLAAFGGETPRVSIGGVGERSLGGDSGDAANADTPISAHAHTPQASRRLSEEVGF